MKQHGKFFENLSGKLIDSSQSLPGVPIIEIADGRRVLIENHLGVSEYEEVLIAVQVRFGKILVSGRNLQLGFMSKHQLVICGRIDSVSIVRCDGL